MVNVYALCGGLIDLDRSGFFSDVAPGTRETVPVICFLISHPSGHVLVDTGVHRQAIADPVGRLGERRAGLFRLRSAPTDEVVSQLALLGLVPDDVRYVVNSHFHFDHCGGNEFFPRSTFLVQRPEMEAARQVLAGATMRYSPSPVDFDHPLDYRLVDGEHDVFGDGQVVLVPTYGHTPGHQSVRVRDRQGKRPRVDRGRLLHAREHGPRRPAQRALGSRRDVEVAGGTTADEGPAGRDGDLRPRRRPVAGDLASAGAARLETSKG